jgi:hypothetical protein
MTTEEASLGPPGISTILVDGTIEDGGSNDKCHTFTGGVQRSFQHILRHAQVVLICWGRFYLDDLAIKDNAARLLADLVRGPFINGLVQYGVGHGSLVGSFLIDDISPPAKLSKSDAQSRLARWLKDGIVFPTPAVNEAALLYVIFPPPTTILTLEGAKNFCGYHESGKLNANSDSDDLFWAIVGTEGNTASGDAFVQDISYCVSHEVTEALSDRDGQGFFADNGCEIADICEQKPFFNYRGWTVEQYWSNWDRSCIRGDQLISMRKFLRTVGVDGRRGLRTLRAPILNADVLASRL